MEWEYTDDQFLITPLLGISCGECEDQECESNHYRFTIGWLCFQLHFFLNEH